MKILMVCLGNICRSPIAEGILHGKFKKYGISGTVDSAGVISFHQGQPPDSRAIQVAQEFGLDISKQRSRPFTYADFEAFDLILTMDNNVQADISEMAVDALQREKVQLFLDYAGHKGSASVPDPYYGNIEGFRNVFKMIDAACEKIVTRISIQNS